MWRARAERLNCPAAQSSVLPAKIHRPRASTPRNVSSNVKRSRSASVRRAAPRKKQRTSGDVGDPMVPQARPGPRTLTSAMHDWAGDHRSALMARWPGSIRQLERLFGRGVVCTTHYSGTGAAEMALAKISTRSGGVCFHSACDIDADCQQVLIGHGPESRPEHVFGDICARPPAGVQQALRACLARFRRRAASAGEPRASTPRLSQAFLSKAMETLSQWHPSRSDLCHCARHGRSCPMFPATSDKYHLEVSGVNCQPWSCAGRRLGWLDERSLPCLVLARQILAIEPDGVCLECTPEFDFAGFSGLLPGYTGEKVVMSPTDLGLPVVRRRMYMFFDRQGQVATRSLSEMLLVSRRTVALAPEAFLSAGPGEVQRYYREITAVPRRPLAVVPGGNVRLVDVLRGGALQRYIGHRRQVTNKFGKFQGCCIVDINNTPEYRGSPTAAKVPTIMRSSTLVAIFFHEALDRLVLPEELPAMHGLQLPAVVSRFPARKVRSLVGNSMHVAQVGCFLQFSLAMRG